MTNSKSVFLAIITANCGEKLNIFLKCIEDLDYDKKSICIYINTNNNRDNTVHILLNWIEKNHLNYKNIIFDYKDDPRLTSHIVGWEDSLGARLDVMAQIRQRSIDRCIEEKSDYYFCIDTDNWIRPCTLKHLIEKDKPIVAPLLHIFSEQHIYTNYFAGVRFNGFYPEKDEPIYVMNSCDIPTKIPVDETYSTITEYELEELNINIWRRDKEPYIGTLEVPLVHCCYLIKCEYLKDLTYISSSKYNNGGSHYEFITFSNSARLNKVSQWICTEELFGWVRYDIGDDLEGKINLHPLKKEIDLKAEETIIEETIIEESESLKHTKELIKKLTQQSKQTTTVQKFNDVRDHPNLLQVTDTYNTPYGLVTLYKNELYIGKIFQNKEYWDIDTLLKLREYIDPNRNILEIGGHCGTSSIVYSSFLKNEKKLYVYEPQRKIYDLLVQNINQNNLQNKIIPNNLGVFCFEGNGKMNNIDIDGDGGVVRKRYNEENNLNCNFGGIGLGHDGEDIDLITIDNMKLDDIGYIHCDAQGAENFIFARGIETITKYRPVILYENNELYAKYLYDNICRSYPNYKTESIFDIKKYCFEQLNYSKCIDRFNGGIDTLLIP